MRLHAVLHGSRANGPGLRSVVWFQGCTLKCPGCWNPETHSFDGGEEVSPEELAERVVRDAPDGTEGVTISGGEPMQQALSLYRFLTMIKALRPQWTIGMFTGYTLSELRAGTYDNVTAPAHSFKSALWEYSISQMLDFIITGRYDRTKPVEEMRADLPYRHAVSSANQDIWLLSRRYTYADFPPLSVEFTIEPDGLTQITGFPIAK